MRKLGYIPRKLSLDSNALIAEATLTLPEPYHHPFLAVAMQPRELIASLRMLKKANMPLLAVKLVGSDLTLVNLST